MAQQIQLIVTSPMRRTLQTTLYALSWLVHAGVPVVARAEWQENSNKPCDTGSNRDALANEFPNVDFSQLDQHWPVKEGLYAFDRQSIIQRGKEARRWLRRRSETVVCGGAYASLE